MVHTAVNRIRYFAERVEEYMEANDYHEPEEDTGKSIEAGLADSARRTLADLGEISAELCIDEDEDEE